MTEADLSITKSDGVSDVVAGEVTVHTYTITVTNNGPDDATNVVVTDTFPSGFTRDAVDPSQGSCLGSPSFTCDLGTIGNGDSVTIDVDYTVPSATTLSQSNTVSVDGDQDDDNATNDSDTDTNTVSAIANISDLKIDTPDPVVAGTTLKYTITVTNAGPSDAVDATVQDSLPSGVTGARICVVGLVLCTVDPDDFAAYLSGAVIPLGTIVAGDSRTIILKVEVLPDVPEGTLLPNTSYASSDTTDPDLDDNLGVASTLVHAEADLEVTKTGARSGHRRHRPDVHGQGQERGPVRQRRLQPDRPRPGRDDLRRLQRPAARARSARSPARAPAWPMARPTPSPSPSTSARTTPMAPTSATPPRSRPTRRPTPHGNDSSTSPTTVNRSADLKVTKTAAPDPATAGTDETFTVKVKNPGPSDNAGYTLTDLVPAGTTYVGSSRRLRRVPAAPSPARAPAWPIGLTDTFTITVHIGSGFTDGSRPRPTPPRSPPRDDRPRHSNDSSTSTTTVNRSADLQVTKTAAPDPATAGTDETFTVKVKNAGPSDNAGYTLTDLVPAGTTYVGSTGGCAESPAAPSPARAPAWPMA